MKVLAEIKQWHQKRRDEAEQFRSEAILNHVRVDRNVQELNQKMQAIQVFNGPLDAYEEFKEEDYEVISDSKEALTGRNTRIAKLDIVTFGDARINDQGSIFARAASLGADALVDFGPINPKSPSFVTGLPVRRVPDQSHA